MSKPRAVRCDACLADERLIKQVRRELARLGLPPLGTKVAKGSRLWKERARAEQALERRAKMRASTSIKTARVKPGGKARTGSTRSYDVTPTCPRCSMTLPATGVCDTCD